MGRPLRESEASIGSDSFLDIIANIVGILIILIVIAGVRVSNAPLLPEPVEAPVAAVEEPAVIESPVEPPVLEPDNVEPDRVEPQPTLVRRQPAVAPKPLYRRSPELLEQVRDLQSELVELENQAVALGGDAQSAQQIQQQVAKRLQSTAQSLQAAEQSTAEARRRRLLQSERLNKTQAEFLNLQYKLQQAARAAGPVKQIEHKLTPVSRVVDSNEIHFQLRDNRVAFVPLEDLLDRLRSQIQRQKSWLLKFRRHEGQVGPARGFIMRYVVERHQMSVIDELRHGSGVVRMGISEWQIAQTKSAVNESIEEALRPGSTFQRALLAADFNTTLTFWVYPDSFEIYRELQQVGHEEGYTVAARPLPFGVPIAGSPQGTRSAGQ